MASEPINLEYTAEVEALTAPIYEKVSGVIPELEWTIFAPLIVEINRIKKEMNAVILAHNYQTPEIFHGVADIVGDSLALAREAAETDADIIVLCGVHFMAETAKLLNPDKTVLIPDLGAGCSLADSITAADVRLLKEKYPGIPVATYVNTSAEVKAETDICVTSGNALKIVEALDSDKIIFLPDEYLGKYVAGQTDKEIILWKGHCEVHERFSGETLRPYRKQHPGIVIIAHPECPPDVLEEADFVGSTAGMINYVGDERPAKVIMVTECSMSDNIASNYPDVEFVRPCNMCPHMKKITLHNILETLQNRSNEILVDPAIADRARRSVERMLELS
jgi:quinolinate synthase